MGHTKESIKSILDTIEIDKVAAKLLWLDLLDEAKATKKVRFKIALLQKFPEIMEKIIADFPDFNPALVFTYLINDNIHCCPTCGTIIRDFANKMAIKGPQEYCSQQCSNQSDITKKKAEATSLKHFGTTHAFKNPEFIARKRAKTFEKHGVYWDAQRADVKASIKATHESNWEGGHNMRDAKGKETWDAAMIEKYGKNYSTQVPESLEKARETLMENWEGGHYRRDQEWIKQHEARMIEKYGVRNPMQVLEIQERAQASRLKSSYITNSSGEEIRVQGYEDMGLRFLEDFGLYVTRCNFSIPYVKNGADSRYFPDLVAESTEPGAHRKFLVEIKSLATIGDSLEKFRAADLWCKQNDMEFIVILFEHRKKKDCTHVLVNEDAWAPYCDVPKYAAIKNF
jgi:hypothetical protein